MESYLQKDETGRSPAELTLIARSKFKYKVSKEDVYRTFVSDFVDVKTDDIFTEKRLWLFTKKDRPPERTKLDFLVKALAPEEEIPHLSKEQAKVIHRIYTEKNLYHENEYQGGDFGVYFDARYCTLKELLVGKETPSGINRYYVYDAKTLVYKICKDAIENKVTTKNLVYFNNDWEYGKISPSTIMIKTLSSRNKEETILKNIDLFLEEIVSTLSKNANELVVKWIVPVRSDYGFLLQTDLDIIRYKCGWTKLKNKK